ncbi:HlyD family secretion protein [Bartonella sp. HY038]|uniref:HlyD family secretion protein n=1 Tax=Bartonella sp. HY038 TaxID=2759660 RepID=UPI0015FE2B58|nr:HlyD family efflux transporter periplasmic adaptor subunit [Bartonella sp. HY038]
MALQKAGKWGWVVVLVIVVGFIAWRYLLPSSNSLPNYVAVANGRIEATEVDIAAKSSGRISDIKKREGDFVHEGEVVAQMDTLTLDAQLRQAQAQLKQAEINVETAKLQVEQAAAEEEANVARVSQATVQRDNAQRRFNRSNTLQERGTVSEQTKDDDQATYEGALSALAAANAQLASAKAGVSTAKANVVSAEAAVDAAKATIERIQSDIDDSALKAPRSGRIQYRIAQPGEVVAAGGRVLNLVDLSDVYMTFFLPTDQIGKLSLGQEAHLVLDALPQYVIPTNISFVSDVAQFTPKTVETSEERAKLMFRVRARIPSTLLEQYIKDVKTGLPGVIYVKLDDSKPWPDNLQSSIKIENLPPKEGTKPQ